ncbi:MAG: type ISP restriction/modification enzyme [Minisyncoccales bacterium]
MKKFFENYVQSISSKFSHKETSEMGYRGDFEILIKEIFNSIKVYRIGHDDKAEEGNKPDFVIFKNDVPILYIEAKDIGISLDKVEKSEQMARYYGYTNLVLTDYVEFRFYRNGLRYEEPIKIANYNIKNRTISPIPENYEHLAKSLINFTQSFKEPIKSGEHLAKIMGGRGQRIRDNVRQFFAVETDKNAGIFQVYKAIQDLLVHDLTQDSFSNMYAQTLVYGLFVARYYDETPETFSRQEARDLIPASNPFLGHFFDHIAGRNFEKRLAYIVDELCEVFSHANVKELMSQYFKKDLFGEVYKGLDPVIHFYEDFLKEYDSELRRKMGAYYTPLPVVHFIVRAVDELLKKDFGLARGLADTVKNNDGTHRVQILDPAVGTGTFLSSVIDAIHTNQLERGQKGGWVSYVHHDLLPRIYGFELMMAPYTIAHLKISMKLQETGFKYFNETREGKTRLKVYLTNSLEGSQPQKDLFAFDFGAAIADEAKEATKIKNEKPIMVVLGNPPYSVSSSNKGEWIQNLISDYKKNLGERKINLDDDYIKFIRFAEHFIEKNKSGIVAMITNNSFIDGITHRQMRKHLLETFDEIYILDLHGNSKKKEKALDGSKDENVFDIQQGVAISIFIRRVGEKKGLGKVYYSEIYGIREYKFKALDESNLKTIKWNNLGYSEPYYFFVPKDFMGKQEYEKGFSIIELFHEYNSGIQTKRDHTTISFTKERLKKVISDFQKLSEQEIRVNYNLPEDGRDWKIKLAKEDLLRDYRITGILYRPFDNRFTVYTGKSKGFIAYPRQKINKHIIEKNNLVLVTCRNQIFNTIALVTKKISDLRTYSNPGSLGTDYVFPLYLYLDDGSYIPNLKREIVNETEKIVGKVSPEDLFDYIYAVLYSPNYREKYKEFLKIDFPYIPYPKDKVSFKKFVALGAKLRSFHLLESPKVNQFITTYPITGSNVIEKIVYRNGKVFINAEQYFGNVPKIAWNFYIGGYQPTQKWLKDRKGRILISTDIDHYQKIIIALIETDRIMKEIDKIIKF